MYLVERKNGRVSITDWNGSVLFSASEESYIIAENPKDFETQQLKDLSDVQLLEALPNAKRISL